MVCTYTHVCRHSAQGHLCGRSWNLDNHWQPKRDTVALPLWNTLVQNRTQHLAHSADRPTAGQISESTRTSPSHTRHWTRVLLPLSRVLLPVITSCRLALSGTTSEGTGPLVHQVRGRAGQGLSGTSKGEDGSGHPKPTSFFCLSLWNVSTFSKHTKSVSPPCLPPIS